MEPPSKNYLTKFVTPYVSTHTPTEQQKPTYNCHYILFHNKRQQKEMGVPEIDHFLAYLAFKDNDATCKLQQNVCWDPRWR
jgi:hypothetical protein